MRLLLAERILRGHTKITQPQDPHLLPDWVFTGVLQAMDFRAAARPPTMFAAIFQSGKIYGIEEIIAVSPTQMDSLSRGIYETSCGALVMTLVDQPDGGRRFNKFLNTLNGSTAPERDLLTGAYPGFATSASSLNKWWALQMATLAKRSLSDPLTADESLAAIEKAITISYPAKPEDVPKDLKKRPFVHPATLFTAPAITPRKPHPDDMAEATGSVNPFEDCFLKAEGKHQALRCLRGTIRRGRRRSRCLGEQKIRQPLAALHDLRPQALGAARGHSSRSPGARPSTCRPACAPT